MVPKEKRDFDSCGNKPSRYVIMKSMPKTLLLFSLVFLPGCATGNTSPMTVLDAGEPYVLEPCPDKPNCVSSMEPEGDTNHISPLHYTGEKKVAYRKLVAILESYPRVRVVAKQASYLKVEVRSKIFGFVDDVAFLFSPDLSTIEVRSASRVGYYDFGVNRQRIENIRKRWEKGLLP
jgi:uncharacterized protein (DUF1499 family)